VHEQYYHLNGKQARPSVETGFPPVELTPTASIVEMYGYEDTTFMQNLSAPSVLQEVETIIHHYHGVAAR
jgi:hypothetical protein